MKNHLNIHKRRFLEFSLNKIFEIWDPPFAWTCGSNTQVAGKSARCTLESPPCCVPFSRARSDRKWGRVRDKCYTAFRSIADQGMFYVISFNLENNFFFKLYSEHYIKMLIIRKSQIVAITFFLN